MNTLSEVIKKKGTISIEKFIEFCLYNKNGYYINSDIIGKKGDFVTAPEISQLFGEIIGIVILDYWQKNNKKKFNLIELGPGKGTLISDILRITENFKGFRNSLDIKLIEINAKLIKNQKTNLLKINSNLNDIKWYKEFNISSKKPVLIIANEFFDCFPIRQFYKKNEKWYEKMVKYNIFDNCFQFKDSKIIDAKTINIINSYKPNNILEISKSRESYFTKICKHIKLVGGQMIIIDYGYLEKSKNFTLQSLCNNKKANLLDNIGLQDITSLVDFKKFIQISKLCKLHVKEYTTQREFLIKNGIYQRAKKICEKSSAIQIDLINKGLERIVDEKNMGNLFKVLIISSYQW